MLKWKLTTAEVYSDHLNLGNDFSLMAFLIKSLVLKKCQKRGEKEGTKPEEMELSMQVKLSKESLYQRSFKISYIDHTESGNSHRMINNQIFYTCKLMGNINYQFLFLLQYSNHHQWFLITVYQMK